MSAVPRCAFAKRGGKQTRSVFHELDSMYRLMKPGLYWVSRYARSISEFMQLETVKSRIQNTPPKGRRVFGLPDMIGERRSSRLPARIKVTVCDMMLMQCSFKKLYWVD